MKDVNDEFRMTNGGVDIVEMINTLAAGRVLRLVPPGAGHSRDAVEGGRAYRKKWGTFNAERSTPNFQGFAKPKKG